MSWTGNNTPHGTESEWKTCGANVHCPKCKSTGSLEYSKWDSSDGAYTDYHYRCTACRYSWWVDGDDG